MKASVIGNPVSSKSNCNLGFGEIMLNFLVRITLEKSGFP